MRVPGWMFIAGLAAIIVITGGLALLAFSVARQVAIDAGEAGIQFVSADSLLQAVPQPTLPPTAAPVVAPALPAETPAQTQVAALPTATLDPVADYTWDDPRRFTVLLLGIDQRKAVEEDGPFRSDTLMVISVDPVRKTAGVLSIPRDLWVKIPGFNPGRINTANALGDGNAYPGGGPALAAEAVRQTLGIPIDKYVRINFDVFTTVVETLAPDGVEICVKEVIDDPTYPDAGYGFIQVHFDPGCQILNAEQLLQYARTRHTQGSDFDRARRQQEVLQAMQQKVLSLGGITHFIGQAPTLWEELSGSFVTNLTLDEIISLGMLVTEIPRENIQFGVIDNLYVDLATTNTGDQVLIPKTGAIRFLIQQVFNPQDDLSLSDLKSRAEAENASIVVFNNTDVAGLAGLTRDWLAGQGVSVEQVGNTPQPTNSDTVIQVYTGKIYTGKYLAALMGLPADRVQPGADGLTNADIAIVAGPDIQPRLSQ
ncbi:MAG: LCP family protein [Chloroflexi bacterium]|nr:LCP family protein [Chloroflexota bacterium]